MRVLTEKQKENVVPLVYMKYRIHLNLWQISCPEKYDTLLCTALKLN